MIKAINVFVSVVAIVLGVFIAAAPARAAGIWASQRFEKLAPQERVSRLRWFRVLGIILAVGGALAVIDSSGFWD
ncbi:MAG TPA: hypothetical protein VK752_16055 [Bryobacteraceae bacterium]|jgi:hypothetical protein|nr:hypothetical protein [Bryobacteraceae bacterium]